MNFFFAEYLICCEEQGQREVLDYLDEYTVGLALSEIFIYDEIPDSRIGKDARVYLDTGLLFKLFGIDSGNHGESYEAFIRNMQKLGMQVMVYDHTVNEMIGIIENSKYWVGNPSYDATLCSETTYYFVTNNWTIAEIDAFSGSIRTQLTDDFNISIDTISYPNKDDIHTPYEADIKEMIIKTYRESGSTVPIKEIEYSIDQDSKSIFYTQHKNGNVVPYHLNDVKNIFITLNRSLAKVGYELAGQIAESKDFFIPTVVTDIKWGTLIWFNSPAEISTINRPRLMSAAYAAFRPAPELTKKLNIRLAELEECGKITPAQCYFLKASPIAQQMLAKKTMNDPNQFFAHTPLEILRELEHTAYEQGSQSRQAELDMLSEKVSAIEFQMKLEKQRHLIREKEWSCQIAKDEVAALTQQQMATEDQLRKLRAAYRCVESGVQQRMKYVKALITFAGFGIGVVAFLIAKEWSWLIGVISALVPIAAIVGTVWFDSKFSLSFLLSRIEKAICHRQTVKYQYSPQLMDKLNKDLAEILQKKQLAKDELRQAQEDLKQERTRLDWLSVDIRVIENA